VYGIITIRLPAAANSPKLVDFLPDPLKRLPFAGGTATLA
jgi:hypothetical protein